MAIKNIVGHRYSSLVVLELCFKKQGYAYWKCLCDCGAETIVRGVSLRNGNTQSCGCLGLKALEGRRKHGYSLRGHMHPLYKVWCSIKQRCTNPNDAHFKDYGGRGISICSEWANSFESFLKGVGERPFAGAELDRYPNNDGNYEPGNVRWATRKMNTGNTRGNRYVVIDGVRMCFAEANRYMGKSKNWCSNMVKRGVYEEVC